MGLRELAMALETEVARQVRDIEQQAESGSDELLARQRIELEETRREAIARENARLGDEAARTISRLRMEGEQAILGTKHALLEELRREIGERATTVDPSTFLPRLVDEIFADIGAGDGPIQVRVDVANAPLVQRTLEARRPDLAHRLTIRGAPGMGPGVEVVLEREREVLDSTLSSRLRRLWPNIEGTVATLVFGDDRDRRRS